MNDTTKLFYAIIILAIITLCTSMPIKAMQQPQKIARKALPSPKKESVMIEPIEQSKVLTDATLILLNNITGILESHTHQIESLTASLRELKIDLVNLSTKVENPQIVKAISGILARHDAAIKALIEALKAKK